MIFLRNSSPVIGDENMPKVPSVAPRWPSADVVAQQSVMDASSSHPPLAFEGLKVRSDLELVRPIVSGGRW